MRVVDSPLCPTSDDAVPGNLSLVFARLHDRVCDLRWQDCKEYNVRMDTEHSRVKQTVGYTQDGCVPSFAPGFEPLSFASFVLG